MCHCICAFAQTNGVGISVVLCVEIDIVYIICKASVSIVQNRWYIVYIVRYHYTYFDYNYYLLSIA